jgi:hypothetical protein
MAYSNIKVGAGKSAKQDSYEEFLQQINKNARIDNSRRGLEGASKSFKRTASDIAIQDAYENSGMAVTDDSWVDDYHSQAEAREDMSGLVAQAERETSQAEINAKQVASNSEEQSLRSRAEEASANMQNTEGWNPPEGQTAFTGPANTHYTDMERANRGLMPSQADELRGLDEAEAAALVEGDLDENMAAISTQRELSKLVTNQMRQLSSGFGSTNSADFINRVAKDTNTEPRSVAEFFKTVLTDHATFERSGVPEAFSDAALVSVLQVMYRNKWAQYDRRNKIESGEIDSESEGNTSIAQDEEIGGLIETAFGKKNSNSKTRAVTGAIARRAVTDALGSFESDGKVFGKYSSFNPGLSSEQGSFINDPSGVRHPREVTPAGYVKKGLFHSTKIKIGNGNDLWVTDLTPAGIALAEDTKNLANLIIPGLRKDVNAQPPMTDFGRPKMKSNKSQKRQDPNRPTGEAVETNEGIHALESVANAIGSDTSYGTPYAFRLDATINNEEAMSILEGGDFIDLIGLEVNGSVIRTKRDAEGNIEAIAEEYRLDGNGNKIPNPRFNPNDPSSSELEYETQPMMGDKMKMMNFNQDLQWMADHINDAGFYYTYFIGGAKRVHVEQTVGNYQSSILVRSLLESLAKMSYNLDNKNDTIAIKSGILKKLGMNKANEGSNIQLASKFDSLASGWSKTQSDFEAAGGQGFAPALIKEAGGHEGWMSLNAINEGINLYNFDHSRRGAANRTYRSGFITEIDGLANGLAINSMQSGDERVAKLTGMIPIDEDDNLSLEDSDVYTITTDMFKEQVAQYTGKEMDGKFARVWDVAFDRLFGSKNDDGSFSHDQVKSRKIAKQALMIFGYGAGDATIRADFAEFLRERLEADPQLKAWLDGYGSKFTNDFVKLSGNMMVNAVNTNFPQMRKLSSVLSAIAGYAAILGLDPQTITDGYDYVEFGLSQRVKDEEYSFRGSYGQGFQNPRSAGQNIDFQIFRRVVDSLGTEFRNDAGELVRGTLTPEEARSKLANLKASKQAPVLITHAMDSLIMMRALAKLRKNAKSKKGFFAAQIYDGVLMTPKDAREFSEALHKEVMHISRNYSSIKSLKGSIEDLYIESVQKQDMLKRKKANFDKAQKKEKKGLKLSKKDEAYLDKPLTAYEEEFLKRKLVKFFIAKVPYQEKGKKKKITQAIAELDKARQNVVNKMDLNKMYQYAWDWPATK